jgi:hypothetical protein
VEWSERHRDVSRRLKAQASDSEPALVGVRDDSNDIRQGVRPEHCHGRTMDLMPVVASDGLPRGIIDDELAVEAGDL